MTAAAPAASPAPPQVLLAIDAVEKVADELGGPFYLSF
jgi:hypothetical protein